MNKPHELSDEFYRHYYRRLLSGVVMMLIVCVVLLGILGYQTMSPRAERYYATTTSGQVIELAGLNMPVVTSQYILQWAALAARSVYNIDFVHYNDQLQSASMYFTNDGWSDLTAALKPTLEKLQQDKLFMSAVVSGPVVILDREIVHGRYTWRVQLPLLLTYSSASDKKTDNVIVNMNIMRVPTLDTPGGIAINNFSAQ